MFYANQKRRYCAAFGWRQIGVKLNHFWERSMDDDESFDLFVTNCLLSHCCRGNRNDRKGGSNEVTRPYKRTTKALPESSGNKTRPTWTNFCTRISDNHFRRQFRMSRRAFDNLCFILCNAAGEETFRPENRLFVTRNFSITSRSWWSHSW